MWIFNLCSCMCIYMHRCPWRPKVGVRTPVARVTGGYEPPKQGSKNWTQVFSRLAISYSPNGPVLETTLANICNLKHVWVFFQLLKDYLPSSCGFFCVTKSNLPEPPFLETFVPIDILALLFSGSNHSVTFESAVYPQHTAFLLSLLAVITLMS